MAITRVQSTTVHVSNADKAIDFYVNKLGFEKRADEPFGMAGEGADLRWVEVAPPGAETVIILAHGYGGDTGRIGGFAGIVLAADDIQATAEQMKAKGVEFVEEPTVQPWGMVQAIFKDQDGNTLVLVGR